MLLKSRTPGPRAKHTNLPTILYGSAYIPKGFRMGWQLTHRFFRQDVKMIAQLVHGDVSAHLTQKAEKLAALKLTRLRKLHVELKTRHHTDQIATASANNDEGLRVYHHKSTVRSVQSRHSSG